MSDQEDKVIGQALAGLKTHQGYKALIDNIIFPMYRDAFEELERKESPESRAKINALNDIVAKIDDKIRLSDDLINEQKEKFNQHSSTPE